MANATPNTRKQSVVKKCFATTGGVLPKFNFALGQLGLELRSPELENTYANGVIFASSGLPASEFNRQIPFSRLVAIRLFKALLIASFFLTGRFSQNTLKFTNQKDAGTLGVIGGYTENLDDVMKSTSRFLAVHFRKLGGYVLPGGVRVSEPGPDINYAGTLPICVDAKYHSDNPYTNSYGCLLGSDGLYVVDGAVLKQVAAKTPIFNIMSNKDWIGHHIVAKFKAK